MTVARDLARRLGGEAVGANRVLAPGPGHSARDRSMSVTIDERAPDGFVVNSFAGDDWRDCRDLVRDRLGLSGFDLAPAETCTAAPMPTPDEAGRTAAALALWAEAQPIAGTPGETYLASRGLRYDGEELRWHPSCPFGRGERQGCMIALVRNIVTNEPQAIHRTAIDACGRKIDRKALGPIGGGCVKLSEDAEVTKAVAIGEGIESTLSIRQIHDLSLMPVWAMLNAGGLAAFPVLTAIESVWIAVDNDVSGAGQGAARTAGERLFAAGIEVIVLTPDDTGLDLNDWVMRDGQA